MSFLSSLLAWANAPFTVALGVTLGFALLQMTGLLGVLAGGDHEGDHDADADVDADADHDVDADHDADADHEADGDDADHEGEGQSFGQALLAGLGVGKVPFSIIWQTFGITFAATGILANVVYQASRGALPAVTLAWTVPSALVMGYVVTRVFARALGRVVSDPKQEATSRAQLIGSSGVVISSKVNAEFGEVRVKDKTGHTVRLICQTREGIIAEGKEVVIVEYDRDKGRIFVAPLDEALGEEDDPEPPVRRRTGSA